MATQTNAKGSNKMEESKATLLSTVAALGVESRENYTKAARATFNAAIAYRDAVNGKLVSKDSAKEVVKAFRPDWNEGTVKTTASQFNSFIGEGAAKADYKVVDAARMGKDFFAACTKVNQKLNKLTKDKAKFLFNRALVDSILFPASKKGAAAAAPTPVKLKLGEKVKQFKATIVDTLGGVEDSVLAKLTEAQRRAIRTLQAMI